ncbi:MAG: replication initiator protein A [Tyzzerella sp.]|nr:replication initiator protein A [Tyzzerella sp.]
MKLNYFYKCEADQFTFYRLPKILVVSEMFSHISYGAKILYGLLLDRMGLSLSNHWHDEFGRAYIIYSIVEIMEDMNCSKATAIKMMSELEDAGLLEKKRRGLGLANIIYLKKFITTENQEVQTLDFRSQDSSIPRSTESELQEV